ncbi:MAG TPA: TetR/AcrR family transcriptional regulator [Verrucomicrobiae bacterium]|nr:TetR/AcrR family transcriptional regulator [Verrucomicrobiae bacterium]
MGRKREFDCNRALKRATRLFWANGYMGVSMRDLLNAMGIGESSFYHLFGSKRRLYLECLKHYNDDVIRRRLAVLNAEPSARKGIRNFFHSLLIELDNPRTPPVCLMSRSLSSDVLDEAELRSYVKTGMALFEESFVTRLNAAKKTGELPPDFPAEAAAQIIFTYLQGFFRVVQVLKNRDEMWRQIETLLTSLGL